MTTIHTPIAISTNPVSAKILAARLGMSTAEFYRLYRTPSEKGEAVREAAKQSGYTKRVYRLQDKEKKEMEYLYHSNFRSRAERNQRVHILREQGYSNAEIAKKIGVVPNTVRRIIGNQDPKMTLQNRQKGQQRRSERTRDRKIYAAEHVIEEYEELEKRVNSLRGEIDEIVQKLNEMKQKRTKALRYLDKNVNKKTLEKLPKTAIQ